MKRKIIAIILSLIIVLNLSGCSVVSSLFLQDTNNKTTTESSYEDINSNEILGTGNYEKRQLDFGYKTLYNENQKKLYNGLKTAVYNVSNEEYSSGFYKMESVYIQSNMFPEEEILHTLYAFVEDYPEVFWIERVANIIKDDKGYTIHSLSSFSGGQLKEMVPKFNNKVKTIIENVPNGLDPYNLEMYIHDVVVDNCEYNHAAAESENILGFEKSFTAYGAIVEGSAVCVGYARAFTLLLSNVGIECANVSGNSKGEAHMWSAVKLNGDWYYVDITWDDVDTKDDPTSKYNFFNITTEQLEKDHTIAKLYSEYSAIEIIGSSTKAPVNFNLIIPECTNIDENFYYKTAAKLYDFSHRNEQEIIDNLLQTAQNKKDYINILIDTENLDFDYCYSLLFETEYKFFKYIKHVNDKLNTGYKILDTGVSTIKKENINVITVLINYD